jgi:hypothetical protein
MDIARSNDHSLLSFYESVRRQVEADKRLGGGGFASLARQQSSMPNSCVNKWSDGAYGLPPLTGRIDRRLTVRDTSVFGSD